MATRQSGVGHALAQAALFEKVLFQPAHLLVEQVTGDFDHAGDDICADGGIGVLDALSKVS
jgi:hypothetical protein